MAGAGKMVRESNKYRRPKVPPEFLEWIEQRRNNIEVVARNMGSNKPISNMQAMRIISLSEGGVELTRDMLKCIKKKVK